MSMNLNYVRVRPNELLELQREIERVRKLIDQSEEEIFQDNSTSLDRVCSIGQSWDLIANLLGVQPLDDNSALHHAVYGASDLNDDDLGYGPARFLLPEDVALAADALRAITLDQLRERFHPDLLTAGNLYPFFGEPDEKAFEFVSFYFPRLVEFYQKAAESGDAIVVYMI